MNFKLIVACMVTAVLASHGPVSAAEPSTNWQGQNSRFLKTSGTVLRDNMGTGNEIQLRGVNLGGWLEWQSWMCPIDSSGKLRDGNGGHNGYDFEVRNLLASRFGGPVADDLIRTFEDAWISERDLYNIRALGFNVVRLTFAYDTMLRNDGSWRPDAFSRMDWTVSNAWKRGIYTILDYHAFLPPGADHDGSASGYFSNAVQKAETVEIWRKIAARYKGNPAVAMYDLMNEPNNSSPKNLSPPKADVVCDLYDQIYRAIRRVDSDHIIVMEGMWDWKTLRDPAKCGYQNVVYSFHWYNWGGKTTADRNRMTDNDLRNVADMYKAWNVPTFIGEFNLFGDKDAWEYAIRQYDKAKLSWTMWTYKNKAAGSNSWGVYTTVPGKAPPVPNLATDPADTIRDKWKAWVTTPDIFALNPMFKPLLVPAAK